MKTENCYLKNCSSLVKSAAPSPCTHTISGSISLPSLGSFNLSLTVLVHYRSRNIFSLGGWSLRIQSGFLVSRPTRHTDLIFQSDPYKSKVRFTWYTRLSLSLARLSKRFYSLSNFLLYSSFIFCLLPALLR